MVTVIGLVAVIAPSLVGTCLTLVSVGYLGVLWGVV